MSQQQQSGEYDQLYKVVIVGDSSVGKSCLLNRYVNDTFYENYSTTIGVDFDFRLVNLDEHVVKLQLWDTAGQERFRSIVRSYYSGADIVIVVFDVCSTSSFSSVHKWMAEVRQYTPADVVLQLVGNKSDLRGRAVDAAEAQHLADSLSIPYMECSAKTGHNVDALFYNTVRRTMDVVAKRDLVNHNRYEDVDVYDVSDHHSLFQNCYPEGSCTIL